MINKYIKVLKTIKNTDFKSKKKFNLNRSFLSNCSVNQKSIHFERIKRDSNLNIEINIFLNTEMIVATYESHHKSSVLDLVIYPKIKKNFKQNIKNAKIKKK